MEKNDTLVKKLDVHTTESHRSGLAGFFESALRKFKNLVHILMIMPLYALGSAIIGLSILPGALFWQWVYNITSTWSLIPKTLALTTAGAAGYYMYCMTIIFVVPLTNFIMRTQLKPWKGLYYSLPAIKWYIHNGSTYVVRYTALEFITPTPMNILFYKMMGMKIGKDSVINTSYISDPSLITIGHRVTIGGSVTLVGHYGQGGILILAPVTIGNNVTVGLKASIMGGVTIGDDAKIMPHSVVLPKTKIGPGETWGGVPAICLKSPHDDKKKDHLTSGTSEAS